ncbi:MAG: hypothetical protein M0C28_25355 [Candidatus Moduliflexus flocculans]|nr:hypothetical protein [Candidatus Moduliflexus flocculans]
MTAMDSCELPTKPLMPPRTPGGTASRPTNRRSDGGPFETRAWVPPGD